MRARQRASREAHDNLRVAARLRQLGVRGEVRVVPRAALGVLGALCSSRPLADLAVDAGRVRLVAREAGRRAPRVRGSKLVARAPFGRRLGLHFFGSASLFWRRRPVRALHLSNAGPPVSVDRLPLPLKGVGKKVPSKIKFRGHFFWGGHKNFASSDTPATMFSGKGVGDF